jgi:glutaredoxin 2
MEYIQSEQLNTSFDLSNRVFGLSEVPIGDIVIEFDVSKLTTSNVEILKNLPLIIKDSGYIGQFELDIFKIKIYSLVERQLDLIKIP